MTSTGISSHATSRGNTVERNITEAAAASDTTFFFEDQVFGLPPPHFDYRQNNGREEELGEEEDEVEKEDEVEEEEEDAPIHTSKEED